MEELQALLEYLVKHNSEHAAEIMELADRARQFGGPEAYDHLAHGADLMLESNKSLQSALTVLGDQHVSR
jgi:hypothetical protein